jgi:hypothetical protein
MRFSSLLDPQERGEITQEEAAEMRACMCARSSGKSRFASSSYAPPSAPALPAAPAAAIAGDIRSNRASSANVMRRRRPRLAAARRAFLTALGKSFF